MELQPKQQQEKDSSQTITENLESGEGGQSVGAAQPGELANNPQEISCDSSGGGDKTENNDGVSIADSGGPSSSRDPGPSSCSEVACDTSGKEEESFHSLFISHASINISGSNPDISESERFKNSLISGGAQGGHNKTDLDNFSLPHRVVVHRVCSDSRIGEGEGFHSSKLAAFYTTDGSFSNSLKALGLSLNNGGSRSSSIKNKNKQKHSSVNHASGQGSSGKEKSNNNNGNPIKGRSSQGVNTNSECELAGGGGESRVGEISESGNGKRLEVLAPIEQSISESKTEPPSTSEGEETITEDVVDDEEELLDEYDEPNENVDCQLDFDAAVTELLLRPESAKYRDSATWTQEDDMPSPPSDLSPVASPRRKSSKQKETSRNSNFQRELDHETGHSHNSLLEQYHQYLLEQQQHKQPQIHRHGRGESGSRSGGRGSQHHHSHHHSTSQHHSHHHDNIHHNPKSSIVGIHQGNLKSQTHSHHQQQTSQPECFTVSSQLLSREAKLYENVPAPQGELETLEILLASGGSGDSNYPPSGGSGSGGGASNTTASTSNTSGTSGQSKSHKGSGHGNTLNNSHNNSNSGGHHRGHHSHHHQQQPHHHHHHHLHQQPHLLHEGYVHGQHSHSATNLNTNSGTSAEQLFSVSDFLGPGGGLSVGNNNGGGPPSRTSWADSGRESLSFDGENNNSSGSTRNLLLIPPPPPPPINYLAGSSSGAGHSNFGNIHGTSMMHSSSHHHPHHHNGGGKHHHSHHHNPHHSSQVQSSESPSHHHQTHNNTKRSRRERLVRQKHAIDESMFATQSGSDKIGGGGGSDVNSTFMAVPSPRRGILPGSMQAANFVTAAASPINLQRHPPASQIMLQENKKNGPLIPCESPYGIMAGGTGPVTSVDWPYPETFGENMRRTTNKSHLTSNILRSRSPQRGRGSIPSKGNNSSFDYGELPSHQMFPKRHLLTSRQFSGHRGYTPGGGGGNTMQNGGGNGGMCPPTGFQAMQHRSFPAGVFSGNTPRSCSMGDLTSSAASLNGPNGAGHHHQNHHNGKSPERLAISSNTAPVNGLQHSTVPLVTSLPLPPATSVTYEFSLAPVSGTLAPGWHLTAVQRGLATAVPLAAAVARRRLPRPRTARQRFGFTDKNEARRAKWTIVITALALLAMSMLLVGVTLRLAPLIDDLGSSSSGSFRNRITSHRDPLSRRASGSALLTSTSEAAAYSCPPPLKTKKKNNKLYEECSDGAGALNNGPGFNNLCLKKPGSLNSSCGSEHNLSLNVAPESLEKKLSGMVSPKSRDGEVDMRREISMTLSIPSRENSVRSYSSSTKSYGSYSTAAGVPTPDFSTNKVARGQLKPSMVKVVRYGSNPDVFSSSRRTKWKSREHDAFYQASSVKIASSKSPSGPGSERGRSRSNSNIGPSSSTRASQSGTNLSDKKKQILSQKQIRNEKVTWVVHIGFSSLLILAITCIVVFLRLSSTTTSPYSSYNMSPSSSPPITTETPEVRKENESLLQSIQPQLNSQNYTTPPPSTQTQPVQDNSVAIQDNGNGNDKLTLSLQSGQPRSHNRVTSPSFDSQSEGDVLQTSNKTTRENLDISGGRDEVDTSSSRSNNNNISSDNDNPSLKINSIRPKRSKPKFKSEDGEPLLRSSSVIINVLNEKVKAYNVSDSPGITKTRHLESSIIRFLKNSSGQGMREKKNQESESRRL